MFKALSDLSKASKKQEDGQGLVEYALILVLVAVVVVVVLSQVGPGVGNIFSTVVAALDGNVVTEDTTIICQYQPAPAGPWHIHELNESGTNPYLGSSATDPGYPNCNDLGWSL